MPLLSITFKYHPCHTIGMESVKPCALCSRLSNYEQLKVQNKKRLAIIYARTLREHYSIARQYNLGTYTCMFCLNGRHLQGIEPHIHFKSYCAGCTCACHWGLKPTT
jgi:hypothetical protein